MTIPINLHPQYVTNENGDKVSVILPIEEFNNLLSQTDINFEKNKSYFQECLENINNGTTTTVSHKDVWDSIDKHAKAL